MNCAEISSLFGHLIGGLMGLAGLVIVAYTYLDERLRNVEQEEVEINEGLLGHFFSHLSHLLIQIGLGIIVLTIVALLLSAGPKEISFQNWQSYVAMFSVGLAISCVVQTIRFAFLILRSQAIDETKAKVAEETSKALIPAMLGDITQPSLEKVSADDFLAKYALLENFLAKRLPGDPRKLTDKELKAQLEIMNLIDSEKSVSTVILLRRMRNVIIHGKAKQIDRRMVALLDKIIEGICKE